MHSLARFRDCFGFRTQKDIEGIYLHKKIWIWVKRSHMAFDMGRVLSSFKEISQIKKAVSLLAS